MRTEYEISKDVADCNDKLMLLYDERRGKEITGRRGFAWCCECGRNIVRLDEGVYECAECKQHSTPPGGWTGPVTSW